MTKKIRLQVIKPSTKMFFFPNKNSSLETECLFGETIEIIQQKKNWIYGCLITDQYKAWVYANDLSSLQKTTHIVFVQRTYIYMEDNIKSKILHYLPLGSKLNVVELKSNWAKITLTSVNRKQYGFVPKNHLTLHSNKIINWVNIAENLIGTPYKWGGRDSLGIDCSALVQLSMQLYNICMPRNTSEQIKFDQLINISNEEISRGCLIFWNGHVAIATNKSTIIHANAHHMMVAKESLKKAMNRIGHPIAILKIKQNYDSEKS